MNRIANSICDYSFGFEYEMDYKYDANGNILKLQRYNGRGENIDDIRYTYNITQNNRLNSVNDVTGNNEGLESGIHTYTYDEIGNLTSDKDIQEINWTVYGKIESVLKRDGTTISYKYDGTGQRIYKKVNSTETHYVRDGSGNILATYENKIAKEFVIYGSSRIGIYNGNTSEGKRTLGNNKYELSNHLGNVLSVISDNKIGIDNLNNDLIADYYEPYIVSESDYYPFGMAMKERSFSNEEYRFGFNTQEKTTELGEDTYTAEFWQYDSKIARRWNVDPVIKHYESSYLAFGGNPIWFVDPSGADSSLYDMNTGEEIARGITEEDDKTAVWEVDTQAENYDPSNPWATATRVIYTIGERQRTKVGADNLRGSHPLTCKGWTYEAQVYEEDLLDMTIEFDALLKSENDFFIIAGEASQFSPMKMPLWISLVNTDQDYDLKSRTRGNLNRIPSYAAVEIGQYSFYNGRFMRNDDYGNISYGYWGRSYGYGLNTLVYGASWAQLFSSWFDNFDPPRDSYMVELGFNKNNNRKLSFTIDE